MVLAQTVTLRLLKLHSRKLTVCATAAIRRDASASQSADRNGRCRTPVGFSERPESLRAVDKLYLARRRLALYHQGLRIYPPPLGPSPSAVRRASSSAQVASASNLSRPESGTPVSIVPSVLSMFEGLRRPTMKWLSVPLRLLQHISPFARKPGQARDGQKRNSGPSRWPSG